MFTPLYENKQFESKIIMYVYSIVWKQTIWEQNNPMETTESILILCEYELA